MRLNYSLLLLLSLITVTTKAQSDQPFMLNIGDTAPPLRVKEWIKGTPVETFEKGKVYVVEFWATWCSPCKAAMPHLSALSVKYQDKITFMGIDILENKNTSIEKIKKFVDSMGQQMNYRVAIQDSNFMETDWFLPAGGGKSLGIPSSFVVNRNGTLAWIGHPKDLEAILPKIVDNTWSTTDALNKRNLNQHLRELDDSLNIELLKYRADDRIKPGRRGQPDSLLLAIDKIIRDEPRLTYASLIVYNTFTSLLQINQHKALEYGRLVLVTPNYNDEPAYDMIIGGIKTYSDNLTLSTEIYQLGAEAYQAEIDHIPYPEIVDIHKFYHKMAEWYWRAKNKLKAIESQQKAIEALKSKKDFSKADLAELVLQLRKYKDVE